MSERKDSKSGPPKGFSGPSLGDDSNEMVLNNELVEDSVTTDAAREEVANIAMRYKSEESLPPNPQHQYYLKQEKTLEKGSDKRGCHAREKVGSTAAASISEGVANIDELRNPDFVDVSTEFLAVTKQAAVNMALSGNGSSPSSDVVDEKSNYRDFRVSDPTSPDTPEEGQSSQPPTSSSQQSSNPSPRVGAYHRRPGEGEERRNKISADQLEIQHLDVEMATSGATTTQDNENCLSSVTAPPSNESNNTMSSNKLVEAKAVSRGRFTASILGITAQPANLAAIEENEYKKQQFNQKLFLGLPLLLVVIVGIILALVFGLRAADDDDDNSSLRAQLQSTTTDAPTLTPTMAPTLIINLPQSTVDSILNEDESPQAQAYKWLINDPNRGNYSAERLTQRYALATFFLSLDGKNWYQNGATSKRDPATERQSDAPQQQYQWLSYDDHVHECHWYNKNLEALDGSKQTCNDLDEYIHLELPGNNLKGTLPPELALLTSMESIAFHRNYIRGTIPVQLFKSWDSVHSIMLAMNQLSGNLPPQVGLWENSIERLSLQFNTFTGPFPSELWQLTRLEWLHLQENDWTDCLPSGIGNLVQLGSLEFHNKCANSSLPTEIGEATSLFRLKFTSQFGWTLPSQIGQLSNMAYLILHKANLSGTIPSDLGRLSNLKLLGLDHNPQLVGTIPASLGSLAPQVSNQTPYCPPRKPFFHPFHPQEEYVDLDLVFLRDTGLTGTIPPEWCNSLEMLCFDCFNSSKFCGCDCPCPN